ncbi:UDP-N-acetylmuramoyl-tripeptide--D-alanyl-D-alanine ligase [Microcoleus sp. FACHB-1515]|uniref:UDP-N-acetylmuramoyl-tripeptide--D-alanyl-D- alanine ligase n=1 Tax=Cyanophyceae TaxID=3028117 RepID=UPI00168333A5|nr:UDP-N-acetylmuramoyl-tripeptide--D-alanyl-D-alanine ligase [Microcoleus sp. FACHB-1515]MBD2088683.1 UDP-N-acetylmuramoyl-tripeptide--D-alanyl-D-alanine ligase [Microcoleus sp. FACHB-1515]
MSNLRKSSAATASTQSVIRPSIQQLSDWLSSATVNFDDDRLQIPIAGISTDTRSIASGDVFLALRGDRFDGHAFVAQAIAQGAIAAIVDRAIDADLPLIVVPDTLLAYQAIARHYRQQFAIPVIAVTGSVGKTTTKELISAVLATQGNVLKTQANYNNEIGVPKTLLALRPDHDFAVIEMGMRAAGEIALLTQIAQPDIAVITNVGTAHIGRLGSEEAIAQAKCELLAELPATGIAVLNHDNPLLLKTAEQVWTSRSRSAEGTVSRSAEGTASITYGLEGGDLHGQLLDAQTLLVDGMKFPLPLPGRHNALNYLAAIAVAKLLDLDLAPLSQGLQVELPQGRSHRYELPNDIVILDETYNAGLESMLAAIDLLRETPGTRHIAVLGTMKELGDRSAELHQRVGKAAQTLDRLLILADPIESAAMSEGAGSIAEEFTTAEAVVDRLLEWVRPGDRLLFKASRAVGLDRVVQQFRDRVSG